MLLWLRRRLNKRQLFLLQLVGLTFFVHCVVLISYFIYARQPVMTIKIQTTLLDVSRHIKVIPFIKRTGQLKSLIEKKQPAIQKQKAATKSVESKKKVPVTKKEAPRNIFKKEPPQKNKSVEPKTASKETKKSEPLKKQEKVEPPKQKAVVPEKMKQVESSREKSMQQEVLLKTEEVANDEPITLGQEEFEALQIYQEVQGELSRHWHPPAGLHLKQPAILLLDIDQQGKAAQVIIEQSSGVLVYDLSARMAVNKAIFPKQTWNRQIRVHF